jgi:hypothetical protein
METLEHFLFLGREVGDHAVEEESGLVEKALGGFNPFDDDAASESVKASVFFRREVLSGENYDREIAESGCVAQAL